MNAKAKSKLDAAISRLIIFRPLYGTVFMHLNKKESNALPTMGVGITRKTDLALYYNPEFVDSLDEKQLRAVLQHEALHVLLHHIVRAHHFNYNHKLYNIAADLAINSHVEGLPDWCFFPEKMEKDKGGWESHQAAEWYYSKLKAKAEENQDAFEQFLSEAGDLLDDHSMWEDVDVDIIKEKVRAIAKKAMSNQENKRGWGDIPGELAQAIIAANTPVVNWKREVRYFINQVIERGRRNTRLRPNRRYGLDQPGSRRNYTAKVLVAMDTSGSVSDSDLQDFATELNSMIDHVVCDLIFFDHVAYGKPEPYRKKSKEIEVIGRGGTNFFAAMEVAEEFKYDAIIIMTDGEAQFPPEPRARVLWALTKSGEHIETPYGKKVVIDTTQKAI